MAGHGVRSGRAALGPTVVIRPARALACVLACAVVAAACHPPPARPTRVAAEADPPYQLADDGDLAARRDELWAMAPGPARSALRAELAAAFADHLRRWLAARRPDRAAAELHGLAELWQDEPAALPAELARHRELLLTARAAFARAGADGAAALTLVLLAAIDPAAAPEHRDELEQILAYADDLARSRHGALGTGTGAIDVLAGVLASVDEPTLVDRQVELLVERANRADASLATVVAGGARPSNPVFREALQTSVALAVTLGLHHRAPSLAAALGRVAGLGRDRRLAAAAAPVAAPAAPAAAWSALAAVLRERVADDDRASDGDRLLATRAALAVCQDGLVRFPDDATLLAAAATHAADLDRLGQPIALYERARAVAPTDVELARRLADLYRDRLGRQAAGGRLDAAAATLAALRTYLAEVRVLPDPGWGQRLALALATYGRGLVGVGRLPEAAAALRESIAAEPGVVALELLATLAWKKGDLATARRHLARAITLGDDRPAARYARAKLLRLAADVADEAGDRAAAEAARLGALEVWADLGRADLPPPIAGERLVESGRLLWGLGRPDEARDLFAAAIDADPDGADTYTSVVTFLLTHGEYDRARDAYYQALASDALGDYYKVYVGLWIVAEGRRRGLADDRITHDYLAGRDGPLWFDELARVATGRLAVADLQARADSFARRIEARFYGAVLAPDDEAAQRRALDEVVASDLVMFFEYDLARSYLRPRAP